MNDKEKTIVIAITLGVVLVGMALWATTFWRGSDSSASAILAAEKLRQDLPIEAVFKDRIVYTSDMAFNKDLLRDDCELRKGKFNECGEGTNSGNALVCAYTCEF